MPGISSFKRAAIGGSLFLVALAAVVIGFDRSDGGDRAASAPPSDSQSLVAYDGDAHGAIVVRGATMMGVTASGAVRWRLHLGTHDLLPYATCLRVCPEAAVTIARSGSVPPDQPDGPRLRFVAPAWRPVAQRPRLRIDRPLLPAPVPARIVAGPTGRAAVVLAGTDVALANLNYLSTVSSNRMRAVVVESPDGRSQRALVLRRSGDSWRTAREIAIGRGARSACLTADGRRLGLVGGGLPRILHLAASDPRPAIVGGSLRKEREAGLCALGGTTMATAIVKSGSGGQQTVLTIHSGGGRSATVRLAGELPLGVWTSAATGTTAILQNGAIVLVSKSGARRRWPAVAAAAPVGPARLLVFGVSGQPTIRRF